MSNLIISTQQKLLIFLNSLMFFRAMPTSDLLIVGVTPRQTTASIQDPTWKCESEGCLDPVFVDGYIEGNQYRYHE